MRTGAAADASRAYDVAAEYAASVIAMHAALSGRMRAQQSQELWDEVLITIDRVAAIDLTWTPDLVAALELSRLGAEWWLGTTSASMVERLRKMTADEDVSSGARLSAAALGMAASDDSLDAESIRWFYSAASDIAPACIAEELSLLKCRLIFETAIGDLDKAERHGQQLIALARRSGDETAQIVALRFAHYPPRRLGDEELALSRLDSAARIADRLKREHTRATITDLIAGVHLDYGRPEQAVVFTHAVTDNQHILGGAFRQKSARDTRALALCLTGNFEAARQYVGTPDQVLAQGRRRAQFMSLSATLLLATSDRDVACAERCLCEIDSVRERVFRHPGQDIIALAYATGLAVFRGRDSAVEFAHWFVRTARRDRLPLPSLLRELAAV